MGRHRKLLLKGRVRWGRLHATGSATALLLQGDDLERRIDPVCVHAEYTPMGKVCRWHGDREDWDELIDCDLLWGVLGCVMNSSVDYTGQLLDF